MAKTEMWNQVFNAIQTLEPAFPVLSATSVGCVNGGWIGCGVGFTAGTIDVIAQYYDFYDRPYLTSGVLGYGAVAMFQTPVTLLNIAGITPFIFSVARNTIGFIAGTTMATGRMNSYLEYVPAPLEGALYGYMSGGWVGAGIGLTAGAADEYLSRSNTTHAYWLSSGMYGASVSTIVWPIMTTALSLTPVRAIVGFLPISKLMHAAIGATVATVYQSQQNKTEHQRWVPFVLQEELYDLYGAIMPQEQLNILIRNIAITTIAAQLSTQRLFALMLQRKQVMNTQFFSQIGGHTQQSDVWSSYLKSFFEITLMLLPLSLGGLCVDEMIKIYANTKLEYQMTDGMISRMYSNETMLKLERLYGMNATNSNTLLKNMFKDLQKTMEGTALLLSGAVPAVIKGYYSGAFLINAGALDMIIYSSIFDSITGSITAFLAANQHKYGDRIAELIGQGETLVEHIRVNTIVLTQEKSMPFVRSKHAGLTIEFRILNGFQSVFVTLMNSWKEFKSWANFLYNNILIFKKILDNSIRVEAATSASLLTGDIVDLLSWESNNAASLIPIRLAMQRLGDLITRLKSTDYESLNDRIDYGDGHVVVHRHIQGPQPRLCLKNFSVGIRNTPIILTTAKNVCIDGPIVAVTGGSGGGKSTALQVLQGIRYAGSWGNGQIEFVTRTGQAPNIVAVGQEPVITPYVTYLEHMTRRLGLEAVAYESRVRDLMTELNVDVGANTTLANALDKPTHSVVLSGGQKKKVALICAIIETLTSENTPDLVILDEILAGLDPLSLALVKNAIQKYWSCHSLVMIVDHKAEDNNVVDTSGSFYRSNLHFNNVTKTIEAYQWTNPQPADEKAIVSPSGECQETRADVCVD